MDNKEISYLWVSFTSNAPFEMPKIYFKRLGKYSGARLYLERVGDNNWEQGQIDFLNNVYCEPKKEYTNSDGDEVWSYTPKKSTNVRTNVMETVTYNCVLEIFSLKKPPRERETGRGTKYFPLPSPNVEKIGCLFSLFTPNFESKHDQLGPLPAEVFIEPHCWRTLNFKDAQGSAPLVVKTPSHFRPIFYADENGEARKTIDSFFTDVPDGLTLSVELKEAVQNLTQRFNKMSLERFNGLSKRAKARKGITPDKNEWTYTFPPDLYSRLNFNFDARLAKWLQTKNAEGVRYVIPMRLSLCSTERENEDRVHRINNRSWEFQLEILPQEKLDVNVLVLDCGTSSCYSCFTRFDRADVGNEGIASDEQTDRRCACLREWLNNPSELNVSYREILNKLLLETLDTLEPVSPDREKIETVEKRLNAVDAGYLLPGGVFKFMATFEHMLRRGLCQVLNFSRAELSPSDYERRNAYLSFVEKLYEIDRQTFETYPMKLKHIQEAQLDSTNALQTIVSEFLFKEDEYGVPAGTLGKVDFETRLMSATNEYLKRNKSFEGKEGNLPSDEIRYYRNPKSKIFHIHRSDSDASRVYQGFIHSALTKALSEYRKKGWHGTDLPCLALTYPATLSPMGRESLRELAMQLGFPKVDLSCDESVAPAVFYLDKFCGTSDELGLENFKTRCVQIGDLWYHNMLIIDVGAGTTDVSLVQFEIRDCYPNGANTNIDGGREYYVTPYLLAAQGNQQYAGNFLTLAIFYYLRTLLVLAKENNAASIERLNASPWLLSRQPTSFKEFASRKLPTDYMTPGLSREEFERRYRRFDALWNVAEEIKIQMSDEQKKYGTETENLPLKSFLEDKDIRDAIDWELPQNDLSFEVSVFTALQKELVGKIVSLASNVTDGALVARRKNSPNLKDACLGVDSIILSGCSSRLPNLEVELKNKIISSASDASASKPFATTRTKVFFEDQYAKSATALGAMSAWNYAHSGFVNLNDNPTVNNGFCTSRINVRNLYFYLSSEFLETSGRDDPQTYFHLQSKFVRRGLGNRKSYSIFSKNDDKADGWNGYTDRFQIGKKVGDAQPCPRDYAKFDFGRFCETVARIRQNNVRGFDDQYRRLEKVALKIRFEIDLEQDVYALVGRVNDEANRETPPDFYYTTKIRGIPDNLYERFGFQIDLPQGWALLENDVVQLAEDIVSEDDLTFFTKGLQINKRCLDIDDTKTLCCWSDVPFKPFGRRTHTMRLRSVLPNAQGEFFNFDNYYNAMISSGVSEEELLDIELKIMLTVKCDAQGKPDPGTLRAHIFVGDEPAYATTEDVETWAETPGLIYREKITNPDPNFLDEYDPFSGKH